MITFLSEEQLMIQAGISQMHEEWETTRGILKKLEKLKMIQLDNELITIINWQKRQQIVLTAYERVKKYRQKKRMITNDNNNDNHRVEVEVEVDKNRIDKKWGVFPSLEELKNYCNERNNSIDPEQFINFYESKGWFIGKNKMKDWKAAVRTWEKRDKRDNKNDEAIIIS